MTTTEKTSLIQNLAAQLPDLWSKLNEAELAESHARRDGQYRDMRRAEANVQAIYERIHAIEMAIAAHPAEALADCIAQLQLLHGFIENTGEKYEVAAQRMVHSVLRIIELETGLDRAAVAGKVYAERSLDPFSTMTETATRDAA